MPGRPLESVSGAAAASTVSSPFSATSGRPSTGAQTRATRSLACIFSSSLARATEIVVLITWTVPPSAGFRRPPSNHLAHGFVVGEHGNHGIGGKGIRRCICGTGSLGAQRLQRRLGPIPDHHLMACPQEAFRKTGAHGAETDNTDLHGHLPSKCASTQRRRVRGVRILAMVRVMRLPCKACPRMTSTINVIVFSEPDLSADRAGGSERRNWQAPGDP